MDCTKNRSLIVFKLVELGTSTQTQEAQVKFGQFKSLTDGLVR